MSEERMDRLEALAGEILKGLAETREGLAETKQRTDSNAKAIEALCTSISELKQEWQKDRKQMYEWMTRIAAAQAGFYEVQADYYRRRKDVEERQQLMVEILNRLTQSDR